MKKLTKQDVIGVLSRCVMGVDGKKEGLLTASDMDDIWSGRRKIPEPTAQESFLLNITPLVGKVTEEGIDFIKKALSNDCFQLGESDDATIEAVMTAMCYGAGVEDCRNAIGEYAINQLGFNVRTREMAMLLTIFYKILCGGEIKDFRGNKVPGWIRELVRGIPRGDTFLNAGSGASAILNILKYHKSQEAANLIEIAWPDEVLGGFRYEEIKYLAASKEVAFGYMGYWPNNGQRSGGDWWRDKVAWVENGHNHNGENLLRIHIDADALSKAINTKVPSVELSNWLVKVLASEMLYKEGTDDIVSHTMGVKTLVTYHNSRGRKKNEDQADVAAIEKISKLVDAIGTLDVMEIGRAYHKDMVRVSFAEREKLAKKILGIWEKWLIRDEVGDICEANNRYHSLPVETAKKSHKL